MSGVDDVSRVLVSHVFLVCLFVRLYPCGCLSSKFLLCPLLGSRLVLNRNRLEILRPTTLWGQKWLSLILFSRNLFSLGNVLSSCFHIMFLCHVKLVLRGPIFLKACCLRTIPIFLHCCQSFFFYIANHVPFPWG
jgi:hypothetical protein